MFVREIFELGYILHGDDKERENLERKRLSLVSAIRQQEARVSPSFLFVLYEN